MNISTAFTVSDAAFTGGELTSAAQRIREPARIVRHDHAGGLGIALGNGPLPASYGLVGQLPALYPEWLGDRLFCQTHNLRFPYVAGEMANGIASIALVAAMAQGGMLGFFGAAGLSLDRVEAALKDLAAIPGSWGVNLIHSPQDQDLEMRLVDLFLRNKARRMSASAFMAVRPAVVRYACAGLHRDGQGRLVRENHLFAKVSRPEVAQHFLNPPPEAMLRALVEQGQLSADEAELGRLLPLAEDITVEGDSGGHTDSRPLLALLPSILALRDETASRLGHGRKVRVGAAGGLGTPAALAAAFALGAAYVVTGSVNQSCLEADQSAPVKQLLAEAGLADFALAPAGDMFELGAKVQVLKRGTLFAQRATQLRELYAAYPALEAIPADMLRAVESTIFAKPVTAVWAECLAFFRDGDPAQIDRALRDPKHRMALVFRWYLGQSSGWAMTAQPARRADYQIWCGPAMGAFNDWARGSFLADPAQRGAVQVALNLLEGAAVVTRAQQFRSYGVAVEAAAFQPRPRRLSA